MMHQIFSNLLRSSFIFAGPIIFTGVLIFSQQAQSVAIGDVIPQLQVSKVAGGNMPIATGSGAATVINFWATWCEACKTELHEMETAFKPFVDAKDVKFYFVSLDKDPAKAQKWFTTEIKEKMFHASLFMDSEFKAADQLKLEDFPTTLLIDKAGKIVKIWRGFKPNQKQTEAIVADLRAVLK